MKNIFTICTAVLYLQYKTNYNNYKISLILLILSIRNIFKTFFFLTSTSSITHSSSKSIRIPLTEKELSLPAKHYLEYPELKDINLVDDVTLDFTALMTGLHDNDSIPDKINLLIFDINDTSDDDKGVTYFPYLAIEHFLKIENKVLAIYIYLCYYYLAKVIRPVSSAGRAIGC